MPIGDMISQAGIMQNRPLNEIVQGKQSLRSGGGNQISGHGSKLASVETMRLQQAKQQEPQERVFVERIISYLTNGKAVGTFLTVKFALKDCNLR